MVLHKLLVAVLAFCGLLATTALAGTPADWDDEAFVVRVKKFQTMKRVTKERFLMLPETAYFCRAAVPPLRHAPHENRFCDVFVSKQAEKAIEKGDQEYPVGAMIVKAKYTDQKSSKIELLTVMTKRKAGYDRKHGDWEYAVIDGKCQTVLARGRLQSCIQCHEEYSASDYVTRAYMPKEETKAK